MSLPGKPTVTGTRRSPSHYGLSLGSTLSIAAIPKVSREAIQAIRSVAWLLDEIEEDAVALMAQEVVNTQLSYCYDTLFTFTFTLNT